jgi:hypothetical protein
MIKKWDTIETLEIEIDDTPTGVLREVLDKSLSRQGYLDDGDSPIAVVIRFRATGYHDSGNKYGVADDCYPPDTVDDRELVSVVIGWDDHTIPLNEEEQKQLWAEYEKEVMEYELEAIE